MKKKILALPILLVLLLMLAPPALAQVPGDGGVIFGGDLTVHEGEKIDGDLVVFGGNVTVKEGGTINGDMVVFGGNVHLNGKLAGDMALIGGNAYLSETAEIDGDIGLVGGNADVAEGAKVEGKIKEVGEHDGGFTVPIPPIPDVPEAPEPPEPPGLPEFDFGQYEGHGNTWYDSSLNFITETMMNIMLIFVLAGIAWLVAIFMPQQIKTAGDAIVEAPILSYGVGFLTTLILALLIITICLACIGGPALVLLGLFGWIVMGQIIGERLLAANGNRSFNMAVSTALGVAVLTALVKMPVLSSIFCIGAVFWFIGLLVLIVVLPLGIGGVILTRFGTRRYYPGTPSGPAPAPRPRPGTWTDADYSDEDLSDLDVNSASEDELKAKIKAALDEANVTGELDEKPKKKRTPKKKASDEETPEEPTEPEEPSNTPGEE